MAGDASVRVVAAARGRQRSMAWLLHATRRMLIVWLLLAGVLVAWRTLASEVPTRLGPLLVSAVMLATAAWFMRPWRPFFRGDRILWRRVSPVRAAPPRVLQRFTRTLSADGEETIEGLVAVSVERGSKTGAAHVGFCPPFASRPQFELRPINAHGVVLKVGQLLPQGARIEARLPAPAEAARIVSVQFIARSRSDAHGPMAL